MFHTMHAIINHIFFLSNDFFFSLNFDPCYILFTGVMLFLYVYSVYISVHFIIVCIPNRSSEKLIQICSNSVDSYQSPSPVLTTISYKFV